MPLAALLATACLAREPIQAEFDRIAKQTAQAINSKNFAAMAKFYAPDCKFIGQDGRATNGAQHIADDKRYFLSAKRFNVKLDYRVVASTSTTAQTVSRMEQSVTYVVAGKPHTYEFRSSAEGIWRRTSSGWLLGLAHFVSGEFKAENGKWYRQGPYVPVVTAQPGGGDGPAPLETFKKIFAALTLAYDKRDLNGVARNLSPSYYMRDLQGNSHTREETVASMKRFFESSLQVDYRSNFLIVTWTKDTAKITSSSYVGAIRMEKGRRVAEETKQTATSWWVLSRSGWQLDHTELTSTAYADAQRQWHTSRAKS